MGLTKEEFEEAQARLNEANCRFSSASWTITRLGPRTRGDGRSAAGRGTVVRNLKPFHALALRRQLPRRQVQTSLNFGPSAASVRVLSMLCFDLSH